MIRAVIGFFALGAVLCFFGYEEHQVSHNSSVEPEPVSLIKLEHGFEIPNNHLEIGDHVAVYEGLVYAYTQGRFESDDPDNGTRIDYCYYPVISMAHPFMQQLQELEGLDEESYQEAAEELSLDSFRVIVRTSRFDKLGDVPETFQREPNVKGLVVNQISSLGIQERQLLLESFPNLDYEKLIILQEGRKPSSSNVSMGMMAGGVLVMIFAGVIGFFNYKT